MKILMMFVLGVSVLFGAVDINTADQKELCKIKGIGPVTAEKILKYRNQNGKFLQIEDLENVKGIGKKTIKKIKGEVTVD